MNNKSLVLTALAASIGSLVASGQLLVGYESWADVNPNTGIGATNAATTTLTGFSGNSINASGTEWGRSSDGASVDGTFGTVPGASTSTTFTSGLRLLNGDEGSYNFTITNSSGSDYDLDFFHFDAGTTRPGAADAWTLSVVSGALTIGDVTSGVSPNGASATPVWTDYDIDLTGLTDNTLENGATVTFQLAFVRDTFQGPAGHNQYLDNIALTGTAVPEPSTYALLGGLFALFFVVRRRRK